MIRQRKHDTERFLTDIIGQFGNRYKNPSHASKCTSMKFHITRLAKLKPHLAGASRHPARGNEHQNINQPNLCQCGNQQYQLINAKPLGPAQA